ncbi:MAG: hypothetical protein CR967_05210 [Proteobacteria bacterium]|nr:MAG: hypothetical protein CR967_05210 [Pseudomonadota bacterium]
MKIAKLSLAAIVAVGAMTTFASASQLEEAVKGTTIDGFVRYRFTDNNNRGGDQHQFTSVANFTMPVAEHVKAGVLLTVNGTDKASEAAASDYKSGLSYDIGRVWFGFDFDNVSAKLGKFEVLSPWTDPGYRGTVGNGLLVLYTGVPDWTFAGAGFVDTNLGDIGEKNLYALAAMGKVGPADLQVWFANMEDVFDYSVYADAKFAMAGFKARLQANVLKLDADVEDDTGVYFGGTLGYSAYGFDATLGYTKNDDKQPVYNLANDDSSGFIWSGGKQINGMVANTADAQVIFFDLGYGMGKYGLGAGVANFQVDGDDVANEWYVSGAYKYSKNFKLSSYYSSLNLEDALDNHKVRFEAKYSF